MSRTGALQQRLVLVGELDEDVFEAGGQRANLGDRNSVFQQLLAEIVQVKMIFDERVNGLTENRGAANAGQLARETQGAGNFRGGDFNAHRAGRLHFGEFAERIGRAIGDDLAVVDVGDVAAALGFVHVVGRYEKRDAVAGKLEEQVPELAAGGRGAP